ncbi:MAG: hypothetical protein MJZ99_07165 [Bacteroidales bacterium]|nr:hypothetical protein [Bacteroidales bacterium]
MDENILGNVVGSLIDNNRNENWGGGSCFMWVILLLFLGGGMGGFGWGNRAGNVATTQDVAASQMFGQVDSGIRGLAAGQANIAYDNLKQSADSNMMVAGGFANLTAALAENRFAQQNCCCETNRNIDGVKYEMAQQTQTITMNDQMNTQKILDKLCMMEANAKDARIQQLTSDLQAAQLTLAQGVQTQNIIGALRPYPVPAYPVTSPYVGINYGTTFA